MNAPNNDNFKHFATPEDFKHRRRKKWSDYLPAPRIEDGQIPVRVWSAQRVAYAVAEHEVPAFCDWLTWHHSSGSPRTRARVIRGCRYIHVVRLPAFIDDICGKPEHDTPDELPKIIRRLEEHFGAAYTHRILSDFF